MQIESSATDIFRYFRVDVTSVRMLPLNKGFGEDWLKVMFERSWIGGEVADGGLEEGARLLETHRLMERLAKKVE